MKAWPRGEFQGGTQAPPDTPRARAAGVLFYNLDSTGNADELSLHGGLPVEQGTKWLANLWLWDPALPPPRDAHEA